MTDLLSKEEAYDRWRKSQCQSAFYLVLLHEAELRDYQSVTEFDTSVDIAEKQRVIKAAITNYSSLCREAGLTPYKTNTEG